MVDQVVLLDVELVDPPSDAQRDIIDPEKVRELAESIRSVGLLEPVLCRPVDGRFEIVAGHRRLLAHRMIGEVKIKSFVRDLSEEDVVLIRAIENDQREDLNPIEKAKVYKRLQEKFGWSSREIGVRMGRHRNTVDRYLKVLSIPEEFQDAVARKKISVEAAIELLKIDDPATLRMHFQAAVYNGVTFEVAQSWVLDYEKTRLNIAPDGGGGGGVVGEFAESLPIFQACTCCYKATDIRRLRMIHVCPECERQVRGALSENRK